MKQQSKVLLEWVQTCAAGFVASSKHILQPLEAVQRSCVGRYAEPLFLGFRCLPGPGSAARMVQDYSR
jgi:hypothetical protein